MSLRKIARLILNESQKKFIKKILGFPVPYQWHYSKFIQFQSLTVNINSKNQYVIEAPGNIPLYETIFEIFDDDCYGIKDFKKLLLDNFLVILIKNNTKFNLDFTIKNLFKK
jgi:hypothetical protein